MEERTLDTIKLHRLIMRRVWYSYLLTLVFSFATLRGFLLGASTALLFSLVSVASIIRNFLAVKVGEVPNYLQEVFVQAFLGGEFLTLVSVGIFVFSLLSLGLPRRTFLPFKTHQSA